MNTKSKKGIIGIILAAIMIASIFAVLTPAGTAYYDDTGNNVTAEMKIVNTLRIYGEDGIGPVSVYDDYAQPFDPTVIPKDSITFNPAYLRGTDWSGQSHDIDVKKYLRMWYEPGHKYTGLYHDYTLQNHTYPAIVVESTYMTVENKHYLPWHLDANGSWFPFPIAETDDQTGLSAWGNGAALEENATAANVTKLVYVAGDNWNMPNKTLDGTIRLEKTYDLVAGDKVQFLDHKLTLKGIVRDATGTLWAKVSVEYAGNKDDDAKKTVVLGKFDKPQDGVPSSPSVNTWFDRHNARFSRVDHNYNNIETPDKACRHTWYARFEDIHLWEQKAEITVGKELSRGDTFYVDSVRYDVPAIEVIDIDGDDKADKFKYITLRTPLPKAPTNPEKIVPDMSIVSSQWLDCISIREIIPLNPPFNMNHSIVDDVNVPLWAPLKINLTDKWPYGDPQGTWGIEYFPCAERYLTMQYPPQEWLFYFRVVPIDTGGDPIGVTSSGWAIPTVWSDWVNYGGPFYPGDDFPEDNLTCCGYEYSYPGVYSTFDAQGWIANDLEERIIDNELPAKVYYLSEGTETRYSTDLLEKLEEEFLYPMYNEPPEEYWTKFDVQTLPDQYTEFVLPNVSDIVASVYVGGGYQGIYNLTKPGDYIVTTSLYAPNALGDLFDYTGSIPRVAFAFDAYESEMVLKMVGQPVGDTEVPRGGGLDLYVNDEKYSGNDSVRIYGENDIGTDQPIYTEWQDPFNPTAIRKDSITFDPAIMLGEDWSAQSHDIDLKKYLRVYYEPCHWYTGLLPEYTLQDEGTYPTIEVESTYMLIDSKHKLPWHGSANDTWFPFPIVENETTTGPSNAGLELFENDVNALDPTVACMGASSETGEPTVDGVVKLVYVAGETDPYNKTTAGTIRIEKTYTLAAGERVQFLDHWLQLTGPVTNAADQNRTYAKVTVWYTGNDKDVDCSPKEGLLGEFDLPEAGVTRDPHANTWYDRHNARYSRVDHNDYNLETPTKACRHTWYARFEDEFEWEQKVEITVGKELQQGDTFYVDGIRYDVPAIEVIDISGDGNATKFKYITIRTPLPKKYGKLVNDDEVIDESVVSSQDIVTIPPCNPIPVNPPFNGLHKIVDDTDVPLWAPLKLMHKWPVGDRNGKPGMEWFPQGERFVTMQYPPAEWLKFFRAVPIDTDGDISTTIPTDWELWDNYGGPFYPGDKNLPPMPPGWTHTDFDEANWIANDVEERIIDADKLEFCYIDETFEPRYSTNLLEILNETFYPDAAPDEDWTKYDIQTLPDEYTEFNLPEMPDIEITHYIGGEFQTTRKYLKGGSYLITTSFFAPNAEGDLNIDHDYGYWPDRFAFIYDKNLSINLGLYINEDPPLPEVEDCPPQTFYLHEGWNMISFMVIPEGSKDPFDIFGQEIWSWDPATESWYVPTEVEPNTGYFIEVAEPVEITVVGENVVTNWNDIEPNLEPNGFNLVGPGCEEMTLGTGWYAWYLDAFGEYQFADGLLQPGHGYWVTKLIPPGP